MILYEINNKYLEVSDLLDDISNAENIGEEAKLKKELQIILEALEDNISSKLSNYAKIIRNKDSDIVAIKEEIKRLKETQDRKEKSIEYLKEEIKNSMQIQNKTKVETELFKFNFRKSQSVVIDKAEDIPEEFKTKVEETKIDKMSIKREIKNGVEVAGAHIVEKQNLQIK